MAGSPHDNLVQSQGPCYHQSLLLPHWPLHLPQLPTARADSGLEAVEVSTHVQVPQLLLVHFQDVRVSCCSLSWKRIPNLAEAFLPSSPLRHQEQSRGGEDMADWEEFCTHETCYLDLYLGLHILFFPPISLKLASRADNGNTSSAFVLSHVFRFTLGTPRFQILLRKNCVGPVSPGELIG